MFGPTAPPAPSLIAPPHVAARRERAIHPVARRLLLAALGGFAAIFASVKAKQSAAFDLAITLKMQEGRSPVLASIMRAASWPGFPPQSRVIPPLVIGGWLARGRRREATFQLAAWGGALISTVVKSVVRRPRPLPPQVQVVVAPLGGSSFPSGHVLTYVGFYGFLAYLISVEIRTPVVRDAGVASVAALLALVGPSRIQQGHHWATDVAASYLLGLAYLLVLVELFGRASANAAPVEPRG
jgi:membrane-associated phospholipid phosphatase